MNYKLVTVVIKQFKVHKEKQMMVTHTYVEWQIETEVQGDQHKHIVYRKDSDFYHLRAALLALYPYTLIPALPQKHKST